MDVRYDMDLKKRLAEETLKIDRIMRDDLAAITDTLDQQLAEILEYGLFAGGKRVRPLLTILAARMCGNEDNGVYNLAIAFEYLHGATLFHDDVIDKADTRRGRPSVQKRFGTVAAILAGDFLHAHSMALVGEFAGVEGLSLLSTVTRSMVDGEFLQLRNARNFNQSEEDYFSAVSGKTALLIGAACELGALFARAQPDQQSALKTYGLSLGYGFQIIDDLLDYQGDAQLTGKGLGNDLSEGKMTLPLITTMQRADAADRLWLVETLENQLQRQQKFAQVTSMIEKYDGFGAARSKAADIINKALEALSRLKQQSNQQSFEILHGLAHYVLNRSN